MTFINAQLVSAQLINRAINRIQKSFVIACTIMCLMVLMSACSTNGNNEDKSYTTEVIAADENASKESDNEAKESEDTSSELDKAADEQAKRQPYVVKPTALKTPLTSATKNDYQKALTLIKKKKAQQAITLLDEILARHPDLSSAHFNKAIALLQLSQYSEAMASITHAEEIQPNNPYLFNLKGIVAREQGDFITAEAAYQHALSIWQYFPEAHLNLAVLFEIYRGKFEQAKTHYQAYLALKPDNEQAKKWLAGLNIKLASRTQG